MRPHFTASVLILSVTAPAFAQFGDVCRSLPAVEDVKKEVRVAGERESAARAAVAFQIVDAFDSLRFTHDDSYVQGSKAAMQSAGLNTWDPCLFHYSRSPEFFRQITDRYCPQILAKPAALRAKFSGMDAMRLAARLPAGTVHGWRTSDEAALTCGEVSAPWAGRAGGTTAVSGAAAGDLPPVELVLGDLRMRGSIRESAARIIAGLEALATLANAAGDKGQGTKYFDAARGLTNAERAKDDPGCVQDRCASRSLKQCEMAYVGTAEFHRELLDRYVRPDWLQAHSDPKRPVFQAAQKLLQGTRFGRHRSDPDSDEWCSDGPAP